MRHDWTLSEIQEIYDQPLLDLVYSAATVHRQHHAASEVQKCQLVSIKTGGCPEDCKYCPQSMHYKTEVKPEPLLNKGEVLMRARKAKADGATRLCMGAAWKQVREGKQFETVLEMIREVTDMGLEVCCTLGLLSKEQAHRLKAAGLHAYNHNLDSSEEFYETIISTRSYADRLKTLENVRDANLTICCGGILGMGESVADRLKLLQTLASMNPHPESVPINKLVPCKGTPLENQAELPFWEMVRIVAVARILMPESMVRLSAGRASLSDVEQALCFMAGANSIFMGEKLLTTPNAEMDEDQELFQTLGLKGREPFQGQVLEETGS